MIAFHERYPEIARKDTARVEVPESVGLDAPLLPGKYALVEYFSDPVEGDCKHVFLCVMRMDCVGLEAPEAILRFGWDAGDQEEGAGELVLADVEQSRRARVWLETIKEAFLTRPGFSEMLQGHYEMIHKPKKSASLLQKRRLGGK
jgi:hypothetical protein